MNEEKRIEVIKKRLKNRTSKMLDDLQKIMEINHNLCLEQSLIISEFILGPSFFSLNEKQMDSMLKIIKEEIIDSNNKFMKMINKSKVTNNEIH